MVCFAVKYYSVRHSKQISRTSDTLHFIGLIIAELWFANSKVHSGNEKSTMFLLLSPHVATIYLLLFFR